LPRCSPVAALSLAAVPRPPAHYEQGLTPQDRIELRREREDMPICPGLDNIADDDDASLLLAACLNEAKTGREAGEVMKKVIEVEQAFGGRGRAAANIRRRTFLPHVFYWRDRIKPSPADAEGFDVATGALLEAFKKTFFDYHTGSEKVLFSHISKAGGTSFHHLAQANGKKMPEDNDKQGGWMKGDGPMWCCDRPVELACDERVSKMQDNNMIFQERYPDANGGHGRPELCDNLVYGVMLRKPLDRIISHLNELSVYLHFDQAQPENNFFGRLVDTIQTGCTDANLVAEALFPDVSAVQWKKMMSGRQEFGTNICGIASNYMTRSVLGSAVFGDQAFKTHFNDTLADDSVDAAIAVLRSMSVVLLLEEAPKDQSQLDLFRLTMGFETGDLGSDDHHMREASAEGIDGKVLKKEQLNPTTQAQLQGLNMADSHLYDAARRILDQDVFFYAYAGGQNVTVPEWQLPQNI